MEEGESYDIQIRGSTGRIVADLIFYSDIYQMTVQVAKHPKLSFYPVKIKENEIQIKYTIEDPGYPKVRQIEFGYTSNSYITNSYVPGEFVSCDLLNVDLNKLTPQNYTYINLYKYADYSLTIKLIQDEKEEDWYVLGLYNESIFTEDPITLAMYNYRTQRMKINTIEGFKILKSMKSWSGSTWVNSGTNENTSLELDSDQVWVNTTIGNLCEGITNFYGENSSQQNNEKVANVNMWIPTMDEASWIGQSNEDSSYGGNLFETNFKIDLSKLQKENLDINSPYLNISPQYYDYQIMETSLSAKVKEDISSMLVRNPIFELCNIERLIDFKTINMIFLEVCIDVLPTADDSDYVPIPNIQFASSTDTSIIPMYFLGNNEIGELHKFLVPVPVCTLLDMIPKYTFTKIGFYNSSTNDKYLANVLKAGSIINFSNFNLYYLPL